MASTAEYSSYIIDMCTAMLENRQGLTDEQAKRVYRIRKQTVRFITAYLQHESSDLPVLLEFLSTQSIAPLRLIVGHADMILDGRCGRVHPDYGRAIGEIRDCTHAIYEELEDMYNHLNNLMGMLDPAPQD